VVISFEESVVRTALPDFPPAVVVILPVFADAAALVSVAALSSCVVAVSVVLVVEVSAEAVTFPEAVPVTASAVVTAVVSASVTLYLLSSWIGEICFNKSERHIPKPTSSITQQLRAAAVLFINNAFLRFFSSKYSSLR